MKNARILFAIILAAASVACTGPVKPRFDELTVDTLLGNCRVKYRFATIANAAKSPALQRIEQSNIRHFFESEEFEGTVADAISEELAQIAREEKLFEDTTLFIRELIAETSISTKSEGSIVDTLLCYAIYRKESWSGAHGYYTDEYHVYSLRDGHEYTAAEFFGEEKMEALLGLIRTKLYEKYDATADREFFPERLFVTDNFRVTPEGVTFRYDQEDAFVYSTEVEISRNELEAL